MPSEHDDFLQILANVTVKNAIQKTAADMNLPIEKLGIDLGVKFWLSAA